MPRSEGDTTPRGRRPRIQLEPIPRRPTEMETPVSALWTPRLRGPRLRNVRSKHRSSSRHRSHRLSHHSNSSRSSTNSNSRSSTRNSRSSTSSSQHRRHSRNQSSGPRHNRAHKHRRTHRHSRPRFMQPGRLWQGRPRPRPHPLTRISKLSCPRAKVQGRRRRPALLAFRPPVPTRDLPHYKPLAGIVWARSRSTAWTGMLLTLPSELGRAPARTKSSSPEDVCNGDRHPGGRPSCRGKVLFG